MKYIKITDNPYIGYVSRKNYLKLNKKGSWARFKWIINPFAPMTIKMFRSKK